MHSVLQNVVCFDVSKKIIAKLGKFFNWCNEYLLFSEIITMFHNFQDIF